MRTTTTAKGYGWQRLSRLARQLQPWCSYCGSTHDLTTDHVDPARRGAPDITLADVQVLCRRCNGSKGNRTAPRPIEQPRPRFSRSTLNDAALESFK